MSQLADIVALLGVVGAWLLFAGPIYQAALELREYDAAKERLRRSSASTEIGAPLAWGWSLLLPVKLVVEWQRRTRARERWMSTLSSADHAAIVLFVHKATGWSLVAAGAWLLALVHTYELGLAHGAGGLALAILVAGATAASVGWCGWRLRRRD